MEGIELELWHAICSGNLENLRSCIASKADPNTVFNDGLGSSPLHIACVHGHSELVRELIGAGADMHACMLSRYDILRATGETPTGTDTPLHVAAKRGQSSCARVLLEARADRRIRNVSGELPSEVAAKNGFQALATEIRDFVPRKQKSLLLWRRTIEAQQDARLIFRAAAEGRPMELARRLRLGKLAGGLDRRGELASTISSGLETPIRHVVPLEAARIGDHSECADLLRRARADIEA